MKGTIVHDVKKIGILRCNAIGDFIVTLPALESIRQTYPLAELVLLGKKWHADFLKKGVTPIDRVIQMPFIPGICDEGKFSEKIIEEFILQLNDENFDILISFQGKGIAANQLFNRTNARVKVGNHCDGAEQIDRSFSYYYYQNEVHRYLELASLIGCSVHSIEPHLTLRKQSFNAPDDFLKNLSRPAVVLHTCGMDERRMWTKEKFSVLNSLLSESGITTIFTGSQSDNLYVNEILALSGWAGINVCGKFTLDETAALFNRVNAVVGIDTGPLHLARAAGAKTVGLYWAPNFINWGPNSRQTHRPVISWKMDCPGCGTIPNDPYPFEPVSPKCSHKFSFIEKIHPEKVFYEVMELLKY